MSSPNETEEDCSGDNGNIRPQWSSDTQLDCDQVVNNADDHHQWSSQDVLLVDITLTDHKVDYKRNHLHQRLSSHQPSVMSSSCCLNRLVSSRSHRSMGQSPVQCDPLAPGVPSHHHSLVSISSQFVSLVALTKHPLPHTRISSSSQPSPSVTKSTLSTSFIFTFRFYLFLIATLSTLNAVSALKILHYSIPRMVDATNTSVVTLDCVYSYDPGDVKLVVRWFHNDSPEPIYQWIPEPDIRYIGELIRPYFDMDFKVSNDRYSKYRALRLTRNLPVSLSGNFSCVISSIANQESRQGQLVVYVPPQKFEFHFVELGMDQIALECHARGVHPRPVITFSEQFSSNHSFYHRFPAVNVSVSYQPEDSLYSASFRHPMHSVLSAGTIYECRLELPGTSYVRKKRIKIIFPTNYVTQPGHAVSMSVSGCTRVFSAYCVTTLLLASILLGWLSSCCWCLHLTAAC